MPQPNRTFDLSIDDLDLIEVALRQSKAKALSNETMPHAANDNVRRIHDLLGRLHNQKTFFRPAKGPYVSG
ncbi:MAG: hypothetical protein AAF601_10525 [Pseudomonadota bacterium]